jgi:excisionase family DNA binding protein
MTSPKKPHKPSKKTNPSQIPQTPTPAPKPARRSRKAPPPPQFLSVDEAAARLGVSPKTIRRLIDSDELPAVRVASSIRIAIGAFMHYIGNLPPARV